MTSRSISFDDEYLWGSKANNSSQRPYCEVTVWRNKNPYRVWCVVDSGADRLQLDSAIAHHLGIPLTSSTSLSVQMADGSKTSYDLVQNVDIEMEKENVSVDILFKNAIPPLLGRTAFLKAIAVAIDNTGWLYSK